MLGKSKLKEAFGPGSHGTTFGGNPLACAVSQTVLNIIFSDNFLSEVKRKGIYFINRLEDNLMKLPFVNEIRGEGLLIGIECDQAAELIKALEENGLLTVPAGEKVIRLLPPLTVTDEELETALRIINEAFNNIYTKAI